VYLKRGHKPRGLQFRWLLFHRLRSSLSAALRGKPHHYRTGFYSRICLSLVLIDCRWEKVKKQVRNPMALAVGDEALARPPCRTADRSSPHLSPTR